MAFLTYDILFDILEYLNDTSKRILSIVNKDLNNLIEYNYIIDIKEILNIDTFDWLLSMRCPISINKIIKVGCLETLKLAISKGFELDMYTCSYAAYHGHLNILKYAFDNGQSAPPDIINIAVKNGHLDIVKYLHDHDFPWMDTFVLASEFEHLDILKYAYNHECPINIEECINVVDTSGECFQYLWHISIA